MAGEWAEVHAHRSTEPSREGLARLAATFGTGAKVLDVARLHGGISTAVHRLVLATPEGPKAVVIKRFPPTAGIPHAEWQALHVAGSVPVATPQPLGFDAEGSWFGTPAIVMSSLPGVPDVHPEHLDRWVDALAETLAAMHDGAPTDVPESPTRAPLWDRWTPGGLPTGVPRQAIADAVDALRTISWPERRFCHCDFHPGNVLFADGAVSGVVDWSSARVAPVLHDVGRARMELSLWPGGRAPDRFVATYAARTGRSLDGLAYWELLAGAVALEQCQQWLPSFHDVGVAITAPELEARAASFLHDALARIDR